MNPTEFSLAVLKQRAPDVYDQLNSVYAFEVAASEQPAATSLVREMASASPLSERQVSLIQQILRRKDPELRWVVGAEAALVGSIREQRPEGLDEGEMRGLLAVV